MTVSAGTIDTGALAPGRYVLLIRPTSATVLRPNLLLATDLPGNFAVRAEAMTGTNVIAFEITE